MKKTTRKNKHAVKQTFRKKNKHLKKQTSRKNRKISGGYTEEDRGTWIQVVFNEDEKEKIKKYLKDNETTSRPVSSTEIRDMLFPDISEKAKNNAAYEIQVILGRVYNGR